MKAHTIFLMVLVACVAGTAIGQVDLQLGTRPQGMGGAFVAVSNDANAAYWNPAGLSQIKRGEVTLMRWLMSDISQIKVDYASAAYPLPTGALAFSVIREAAELEEGIYDNKNTMSYTTFSLSYGLPLNPYVSAGVSYSRYLIDSRIATGGGMGFDFGLLVTPLPKIGWTVGAAAKYVGGNLKNENLTPYYVLGTAFRHATKDSIHHFLVAVDANTRKDIDGKDGLTVKFAGGLEYQITWKDFLFAARGGIGTRNYTAGGSIGYRFVSLDYAFVAMNEETIGNSHKFGVSFHF